MPQTFVFNDIFRARLSGTISGERFENVIHMRFKGGSVGSVDLASGIRNFFLNQLMAPVSNQVQYNSIGLARVSPQPITTEDVVAIVPMVGANANPRFPNQLCYLMKVRCDNAHLAHRRGRLYLPGVCTSHWTSAGWSFTAITQFNSISNIIQSEFAIGGGTSLEWGVFSRGIHDTAFAGMRTLTWSGYPAIQRSRRPRVF